MGTRNDTEGHEHVLRQTRPSFLDSLDSDRDVAFAEFYDFTTRLLTVRPPGALRRAGDDRPDWIHDFVIRCCSEDFAVLRRYEPRGVPFAAWLLSVARHWFADRLRRREMVEVNNVEDFDSIVEDCDQPHARRERQMEARAKLEQLAAAMAMLGDLDRKMLLAAIDGRRPKAISQEFPEADMSNKQVADHVRYLRKRVLQQTSPAA